VKNTRSLSASDTYRSRGWRTPYVHTCAYAGAYVRVYAHTPAASQQPALLPCPSHPHTCTKRVSPYSSRALHKQTLHIAVSHAEGFSPSLALSHVSPEAWLKHKHNTVCTTLLGDGVGVRP
jgi:hypothetical protein